MRRSPPPLPTARELMEGDLSRFVRSERDLDALLAYVERSSLPPEAPVTARSFGPTAPPPVPSDQVDLDAIVARLSSEPSAARVDPTSRIDLDEVVERVSATPALGLPSLTPRAMPGPTPRLRAWHLVAAVALSFSIGSALTLGIAG